MNAPFFPNQSKFNNQININTKFSLLWILLLFTPVFSMAQVIETTAIGYQEYTTTVVGSVADEAGNNYYTGHFKGELRINNQTLAAGQGGFDIFLVKTNNTGNIIWYKTFGGLMNEFVATGGRSFYYQNGALYLYYNSSDTARIGTFTLNPYPNAFNTPVICKINAGSGDVVWAHKTSMAGLSFFGNSASLNLSGSTISYVRWDDQQLLDSTGMQRNVFMRLDTLTGNVISLKKFSSAGSATIQHVEQLSNARLAILLRTSNATALNFDNQSIPLPSLTGYVVLLKTDTGFTSVQHRIMNPAGSVPFQIGYQRNNLAFSAAKDSIYLVLNSNSTADNIFYSMDGYNQSLFRKNVLLVLDTNFITRRLQVISPYPNANNSIQYKSIELIGQDLFLFGQVAGNNQAPPLIPYPSNVVNLDLLPGLIDTFNLEGPSKSFVIKTDPSFSNKKVRWLGNHTPYETNSLGMNYLTKNGTRFIFSHGTDNVWNPWVVDSSLAPLQGTMQQNADKADNSTNVEFLSDGSLIVAGTCHGKTMLDTSYLGIGMGGGRRDAFILRRSPAGAVIWYKRVFSSYASASFSRIIVKNDKTYLFLNFGSNTNKLGYNYVKIDTSTLIATSPTSSGYKVLLVIDREGRSRLIELDDNLPCGRVNGIDIYPNGDIAAVTMPNNLGFQLGNRQFPNANGFYVVRLDSNGVIKKALKYYRTINLPVGSVPLQALSARLLNNDTSILMQAAYSMNIGQSGNTYYVHDGLGLVDSVSTINYNPASTLGQNYNMLINTDLLTSKWEATIGPGSLDGPNTIAQVADKIFMTFTKGAAFALKLNGQTILADSLQAKGILTLTSNGAFSAIKPWLASPNQQLALQPVSLKAIGNYLYLSGSLNRASTFDTISVGYEGNSDALTLKYDTTLIAKQSFRLASRYGESMYEVAVFNDSIYSFAYNAQEIPNYYSNRTAVNPLDRDQDAFLGTLVIRKNITPVVPVNRSLLIFPNPTRGENISMMLAEGNQGVFNWRVVDISGRAIEQGLVSIVPNRVVIINFHQHLVPGNYFLQLFHMGNKNTTTGKFIVIR